MNGFNGIRKNLGPQIEHQAYHMQRQQANHVLLRPYLQNTSHAENKAREFQSDRWPVRQSKRTTMELSKARLANMNSPFLSSGKRVQKDETVAAIQAAGWVRLVNGTVTTITHCGREQTPLDYSIPGKF